MMFTCLACSNVSRLAKQRLLLEENLRLHYITKRLSS